MADDTTHTLTVGQGEQPDPLIVQVLDADSGDPIDLATADRVRFRMASSPTGVVVDNYARVADPDQGQLVYDWSRSDLDIPSRLYDAAFRIRFADRRTLIVPTADRLTVDVRETPFSHD